MDNFARYYGNDWASLPFRLCLTNTSVSINDFKQESILKQDDTIYKIQSFALFNLEYYIWIVDQFFQPAFLDNKM